MGILSKRLGLLAAIIMVGLDNAPMPAPKPTAVAAKQSPAEQRQTTVRSTCNGTAKDRSSELCAAWASADAARAATFWSIINVAIASLGFIGLGLTIWISRKTLRASVIAERPHVRFYRTLKVVGSKGQIITVNGINFRNYGRTPALVKSISLDFKLATSPPFLSTAGKALDWPSDTIMPQDEEWPRKHYLGPFDKSDTLHSLVKQHDPKGKRLFVFGQLTYLDAFGEPHVTRFCRQWDGQNFTYAENREDSRFNYSD